MWLFRLAILIMVALTVPGLMIPDRIGPAQASTATTGKSRLGEFLAATPPAEIFPGADRLGLPQGSPPLVPAYQGETLLGHVFLNSDFVNAIGYSGKPIHVLVGLDLQGTVVGARLVAHSEPIVLIGIPEKEVVRFINGYIGRRVLDLAATAQKGPPVDIISGATVTVVVIGDTITRAGLKVMRLRGQMGAAPPPPQVRKSLDLSQTTLSDWPTLLGNGAIRRLALTVGEVNAAFSRTGNPAAIERPEPGADEEPFIDLYAAVASIPAVGRTLLGDAEYEALQKRLKPGQTALWLAGAGRYSFKGSGYVRGGIFDRFEVIQEDGSTRFHDRNHKRLGDTPAAGAPPLAEIGVFVVPEGISFDPAQPWRLSLLVARAIGPLDKVFLTFDLPYAPPDLYLKSEPVEPAPAPPAASPASSASPTASPVIPQTAAEQAAAAAQATAEEAAEEALWKRMWQGRTVDIVLLGLAMGFLTILFFFQMSFARRPVLLDRLRLAFLALMLVWLGWITNAQLSVVNVLTVINAVLGDFRWDYFLMDPLVFILWFSVAASLLFWGRGVFCGWICPFGALQELLNRLAKVLRVPQITVPWALHERLWPIKYILFLGLFAVSLHSMAWAEYLAEVEPFKTAIILRFSRDGPFVAYALALLAAGLFIERFFCRYLCPLGAALAIPGRLRMFEWLKRYRQCGHPCRSCERQCMVQAIHPEGNINPNECIYCMHCQTLYVNDRLCPVMVQKRLKTERRQALQAGAPLPAEDASPSFTAEGEPVFAPSPSLAGRRSPALPADV